MQAEYNTIKFKKFKKKATATKKKQNIIPVLRRRFWLFLYSAPLVMTTSQDFSKKKKKMHKQGDRTWSSVRWAVTGPQGPLECGRQTQRADALVPQTLESLRWKHCVFSGEGVDNLRSSRWCVVDCLARPHQSASASLRGTRCVGQNTAVSRRRE